MHPLSVVEEEEEEEDEEEEDEEEEDDSRSHTNSKYRHLIKQTLLR